MKLRAVAIAIAVALTAAPAASARVAVRPPPREEFCTDRIRLGVRHVSPGPRVFSISVYAPSGRRVFYRSGIARAAWRIYRWRPISDRRIRYGFSVYRIVYRVAGSKPRTFRTRVLCGE